MNSNFLGQSLDPIDFELSKLRRLINVIYRETTVVIEEARENGSLQDRIKAIELAMKTHSYATSDIVRSRITKISAEAANCLNGSYEDREIELSEWAAEATSQIELNQRAAEVLKENRGYFQ